MHRRTVWMSVQLAKMKGNLCIKYKKYIYGELYRHTHTHTQTCILYIFYALETIYRTFPNYITTKLFEYVYRSKIYPLYPFTFDLERASTWGVTLGVCWNLISASVHQTKVITRGLSKMNDRETQ